MGRTVLITGTNRGLGKSILEEFCREPDIIILAHARKGSSSFSLLIDGFISKYKCKISPVYFDLSDEQAICDNIKELLYDYKRLDVLVNNAGIVQPNSSFLMTSLDRIRQSFQVNFFAPVLISQLVAKAMIRNRSGVIVNMASIAAYDGSVGQFEYVTSKAAVVGMTMKLAMELAPYGIRCNAVAPGLIETDMLESMDKKLLDTLLDRGYLKRLGQPKEIAKLVYFLSSPDSSFINGQTIRADGGRV